MTISKTTARPTALAVTASLLGGCNVISRVADIGRLPDLTPVESPTAQPNYQPVSFPMPSPVTPQPLFNSMWRPGARAFFKDQRAGEVGDILTVIIDIEDKGEISNETTRTRIATEDATAAAFLGYESSMDRLLPGAINPANLVDLDSETLSKGTGSVTRDEEISLMIAAAITQIMPNGNMVIYGRQEVRVNFEVRDLEVAGVIRPEDVSSTNTITYEKIAEARISYGGRGQLTDVQQPRYGQQLCDIIFPF
jgi:flagellar L-ring protein precursor FlgH